jgi:hypothetical protein
MILNRARSNSDSESDSKPLRTTHPPDLGGQNGPIIARVQKCVYVCIHIRSSFESFMAHGFSPPGIAWTSNSSVIAVCDHNIFFSSLEDFANVSSFVFHLIFLITCSVLEAHIQLTHTNPQNVSNPPNLICPWGSGRVVKPPEARRYCSLDRLQSRSVILCSSSSISVCVYLAPTVTSGHRALSSSMIVFYSFNWTSHAVIFETPICPLEKRTGTRVMDWW